MSTPQYERDSSLEEDGRDSRLENLLNARRKLNEAVQILGEATNAAIAARKEVSKAYNDLSGETVRVEGFAIGSKSPYSGATEPFLVNGTLEPLPIENQLMTIMYANEEGVIVGTLDHRDVYVLDADTIHHPQPSPPAIDF